MSKHQNEIVISQSCPQYILYVYTYIYNYILSQLVVTRPGPILKTKRRPGTKSVNSPDSQISILCQMRALLNQNTLSNPLWLPALPRVMETYRIGA